MIPNGHRTLRPERPSSTSAIYITAGLRNGAPRVQHFPVL
jgi:hypothetical protein